MKKFFMMLLFTSLFIAGCGNGAYKQAMENGKLSLESGDFEEALFSYENALEEKPGDKDAQAIYDQIVALNQVIAAIDNQDYEDAIWKADNLFNGTLDSSIKSQLDRYMAMAETELAAMEEKEDEVGTTGESENKKSEDSEEENPSKSTREEHLRKLKVVEEEVAKFEKKQESGITVEMTEAQGEILKLWDKALNEIYGELEKQLSLSEMSSLRDEQRTWITYRDETAKEESLQYEGGSMESLQYISTQSRITEERCYELVEGYME